MTGMEAKGAPDRPSTRTYDAREGNGEPSQGQVAGGFRIEEPAEQTLPFVFASPHSGRAYPQDFVAQSKLDPLTLRRSEDSFVDEIVAAAPEQGAPLIMAQFPRAYLDVNREPWELDPDMFKDPLPSYVNTRSLRVAGGIGTIAKVVSNGADIYSDKLDFAEAERRVRDLYEPYHAAVRALLDRTFTRFGFACLIDCHSMPSIGGPMDQDHGTHRADIVLGDRYGTSCAPSLVDFTARSLRGLGYVVTRNNPYAGGYTTEHYGRPTYGVHAVQIEINRRLYMDERQVTRGPGLAKLARDMARFIESLHGLERQSLLPTL